MKRPLTDHEYQINGGEWIGCTTSNCTDHGDGTYTITDGLDVNIPIGSLKVRVKALGINPASAVLQNTAAFNGQEGSDIPLFYINQVKTMAVGDADQLLSVVSSSAGAVTFVSSDTSKATIVVSDGNSYLHAVATGDVTVTAYQAADSSYTTATDHCLFTVVAATTVDDITYSTVALGKAATADNGSFNVRDLTTYTLRKYSMVSGKAVYQKTIPSTVLTTIKAVKEIIYSESLGAMPASPIVDVDSSFAAYHFNKLKNIGASNTLDNNLVQFAGFKRVADHGTVTITQLSVNSYQFDFVAAYGDGYGAFVNCLQDVTLPAGAWSLACEVRLLPGDSGKSAYYGLVLDGSGASYLTMALTDTDQTITYPVFENNTDTGVGYGFPLAASLTGVATTLSIIVSNIRFIPGVGSGVASELIPDLVFNKGIDYLANGVNADLSFKFSNAIAGAGNGLIHYEADGASLTIPQATMLIAMKIPSSGFLSYNVLASQSGEGLLFYLNDRFLTYVGTWFGTISETAYDFMQNEWFILAISYSETVADIYINGLRIAKRVGAFGNITLDRLLFLGGDNNDFKAYGDLSTLSFWNSKLSDANIAAATTIVKNRMRLKNHFVPKPKYFYISEGDSITWLNDSYQRLLRDAYTPQLFGSNPAENGAVLGNPGDTLPANSMYARQSWVNQAIVDAIADGRKVVMTILIGTNDMGALTSSAAVTAYYTKLCDYVGTARALGAKVAMSTILDIDNLGFMSADKTYLIRLNNLIRGDATQWDGLIDYYADPAFTTATTTYYNSDLVHPNGAGFAKMKVIAKPVLDALLAL
ncbi:GDSL-type esterase/lipase family protein [Mucilaginibacter ginsenosidivorax]|uniref:SGNH hydrolase-type esterase domain-containing protein n=1 Tax=Mucilaginibacter ginsenosidivorax TaxID=862126 RepID=A0A5B8W9X3_9SPHI|nr:GDSL-type esterase/lipase family protein [Mucilaginibacter ginsenosidivorax]QEC79048.1 hypothetical protein FSB76_24995 [Mucilaginibacter ginsenosidivorax]